MELQEEFNEVLNSNDTEALKTSLQNLMVLFETQNKHYLELKNQITFLKQKKNNLIIEKGDIINILNENNKPNTNNLIDQSYELLASIKKSRKIYQKISYSIENSLTLSINEISKIQETNFN